MRTLLSAFVLMSPTVLACASVPLETPVGSAHRPPASDAVARDADIFGEQFADTDERALTDFRDALDPHGTWVDDPALGTIWVPSRREVGRAFFPYASHGHFTRDGREWVWVSSLPWGWVTFHYGRWMYTADNGWAWVPGRRYAGAWVVWRTGASGYAGWGPAPANWYFRDGYAMRVPEPRAASYVYARTSDLFADDVVTHTLRAPRVTEVAARTRPFAQDGLASTYAPLGTSAPTPEELGIASAACTPTPRSDPGLQRAWLLAKPDTAEAAGYRAPWGEEPHLREWVAGSPRYVRASHVASADSR